MRPILMFAAVALGVIALVWTAQQPEVHTAVAQQIALAKGQPCPAPESASEPEQQIPIVDLPQDAERFHLSVVVENDLARHPEQRRLVEWFARDPALVRLRAQTHFHVYTPATPYYAERLAPTWPERPCVVLQEANGRVLYKASQNSPIEAIPNDPATLARRILNCCPKPQPPAPIEPGPVNVTVSPITDIGPVSEPEPEPEPAVDLTLLIAAVAGVIAGLIAAFVEFKRRVQ